MGLFYLLHPEEYCDVITDTLYRYLYLNGMQLFTVYLPLHDNNSTSVWYFIDTDDSVSLTLYNQKYH